ncbi:rRNA maturation RNase YbeY [Geomonas sp. Red69]|uniref:Endoribonuclease YbeY n=1 Tax=Geomonas diazotrophica TaxID=2843197 RepID=A0ABX8JIY8_9BACT|nr:rRNA maturation RNase YbeY [Geomonas diazotrophica]QWV96594.1 rRNA maturation RNase YbeY [Geomonas nitrogeniifigens]QXE85696.1 rRNA maturation RNase YbeY [Geomonas nitrogeniifigens]
MPRSQRITIANRQRRIPVAKTQLRKVAQRILDALGCPEAELSVSIVGDRAIRVLNREYLGRDKATNVISFAMQEGEFGSINPGLLGDVVISVDTAAREAEEAGDTFLNRLYFLLLHGVLHITGYDHERSGEAEAARMEAKEREIFSLLVEEGLV